MRGTRVTRALRPLRCFLWGNIHEHFLHWTPDGSHLVFDVDDTIWTLDIEGARLLQVADVDLDYEPGGYSDNSRFLFGFYADVSPDGSRIVYATCEYFRGGYEIATVKIDGTDERRLTQDGYFEHYPVWSPDGKQIAFVENRFWADPTKFDEQEDADGYPLVSCI